MSWWYFFAAVPVLGILVLGHEFGHFITAKWAGIRVEEFGIGFPPRIFGIKRGETIYSINWLPIGGFVRMPGENGEMTDETGAYDPRNFASKPASKRAIVLLAGVTMNILMAFALFLVAELVGQPAAIIGKVTPGSPAAAAGLVSGDRIVSVNGQHVKYWTDVTNVLGPIESKLPKDATTFPVTLVYYAPHATTTTTQTIQARANPPKNQGAVGIETSGVIVPEPITAVPGMAVHDMWIVTSGTVGGVASIITGQLPWNKAVSGPVGIVTTTGEVASTVPIMGPYLLLFLTGVLSLSLAFVNILPIPALDGGRVLFIVIEVLRRGKRIPAEREAIINLAGMAVLLALMVIVTFNDVSNLFH